MNSAISLSRGPGLCLLDWRVNNGGRLASRTDPHSHTANTVSRGSHTNVPTDAVKMFISVSKGGVCISLLFGLAVELKEIDASLWRSHRT